MIFTNLANTSPTDRVIAMFKSRQYSDGVLAAAVKDTTTPMINQIDLINQCEKGAWVLFVSLFSPSSDWALVPGERLAKLS